jgi:hypothetical protein
LVAACALAGPLRADQTELAPPPRLVGSVPVAQQPAPPADPDARFRIDADRLHFGRVEDDVKVRSEDENPHEFTAYNEVLLQAHRHSAADLERHATRDVMFRDLVVDSRKDYQFKLVYLEGRLKRLRRLEPTRPLAEAGVKNLYEGWLFPQNGTEPVCVLTTELPEGLEPAIEYSPSKHAGVAAYSFKLMRYEAADPKDPSRQIVRRAPLLMGRSFKLFPEPARSAEAEWWGGFLPGLLAVLAGIAAVTFGLTWWFRRGDRQVRRNRDDRLDRNPYVEPEVQSSSVQS